jgi:hypothetical protein
MDRETRSTAADIGCGLLAFLLIRLLPLITGQHQDIRPFVLTTFLAFLAATLYRFRHAGMHRSSALLYLYFGGIAPA